jgi:GNAT superfamily N-acetyltransferase
MIAEEDGLVLVSTGFPTAALNHATAIRLPADPQAALGRARAFFARSGVPWRLRAWGEVAAALAPVAAEAGFHPRPPEPGLLLAPLPHKEDPLPAGMTIRTVADPATLRRFNDTFAAAFELPREGVDLVFGAGLLEVPGVEAYLGWADGVPVAMALGLTSHRIALVFAVGTLPAYRRRGFGAAMTWRAAVAGRSDCLAAYLTASALGVPVYVRMGFRHVTEYRRWAG